MTKMTRKERQPAHAEKMAMKKAGRAKRRPGFTPMANKRITAMIAAETVVLIDSGVDPAQAQHDAVRNVARKLPAPKPSKLFVRKPSKNDDPVYRKAVAA